MDGHEHARTIVRDFLAERIPLFLAFIREQQDVQTPVDPPARAYLLDDMLPEDRALYPCVVVRSTDAPRYETVATHADGEASVEEVEYEIEVVVAAQRREFSRAQDDSAPSVLSSVDRDRLMLAARWALKSPGTLDERTRMASYLRESTGPASQLLDGKPVAAGTITFTIAVTEQVPALALSKDIASHSLVVDGRDASQPIT